MKATDPPALPSDGAPTYGTGRTASGNLCGISRVGERGDGTGGSLIDSRGCSYRRACPRSTDCDGLSLGPAEGRDPHEASRPGFPTELSRSITKPRYPKTLSGIYIEIIGEASAQVSDTFRAQYPEIAWRHLKDLRNALIHGYASVDLHIVWSITRDKLPPLANSLHRMLEAEEEPER